MILVTGWTGNTGDLVVKQILKQSPEKKIIGITRNEDYQPIEGLTVELADLSDELKVEAVFKKYSFAAVIHIANIRYSPLLLNLADKYEVPHIILVHTTGIYSKYQSCSGLYREIEGLILNKQYQGTSFTILRPTMIYGNCRDHNMHKLIRFLSRFPVFPVFGDGSSLMQPVHVEDLADAIVACIGNNQVRNTCYDLSGGTVLQYQEILKTITGLLAKKIWFVHIPIQLAIGLATLYEKISRKPAISVEQVKRMQEDKAYSHENAVIDLNFNPRTFHEGISREINELRKEGLIR